MLRDVSQELPRLVLFQRPSKLCDSEAAAAALAGVGGKKALEVGETAVASFKGSAIGKERQR